MRGTIENMYESNNHFEKKEGPNERLSKCIEKFSAQSNAQLEEMYGIRDFLDANGRVSMEHFIEDFGKEVESDLAHVYEKEKEWSGAEDERIRQFYKETYGIEGEKEIVGKFKENKEKDKNAQLEKIISCLFHVAFGSEYLVMQSSAFDDYEGQFDTVVIDKKTGDVVCTFDEVHDHAQASRAAKKKERMEKIMHAGGKTLKYGLEIKDGEVRRKEIHNLPVLCIGMDTASIENILKHVDELSDMQISPEEEEVCMHILASLREQIRDLRDVPAPAVTRENLSKTERALVKMEAMLATRKEK